MTTTPTPNHSPQEDSLLEQTKRASEPISKFLQGDTMVFWRNAEGLSLDHPHKPIQTSYSPWMFSGGDIFPFRESNGQCRLTLKYRDGSTVEVRQIKHVESRAIYGTMIDDSTTDQSYFLTYEIGNNKVEIKIVDDIFPGIKHNGIPIHDEGLTAENVEILEQLAQKVEPLIT